MYLTRGIFLSSFTVHMSIKPRVDHVLSKETWTQIWICLFCCHLANLFFLYVAFVECNGERPRFPALKSNGVERNWSVCSHVQLTTSTRAFTLQRLAVRVHSERLPMWSECTGRSRGRSVNTGNWTRTVRERYARRIKLAV